jgi:hypothetical protein
MRARQSQLFSIRAQAYQTIPSMLSRPLPINRAARVSRTHSGLNHTHGARSKRSASLDRSTVRLGSNSLTRLLSVNTRRARSPISRACNDASFSKARPRRRASNLIYKRGRRERRRFRGGKQLTDRRGPIRS